MKFPERAIWLLALCLVAAGSAVAAGQITSAQIKDNSVTSTDVRNENLTTSDIRNGTLTGLDIKDQSIGARDLTPGAVDGTKLAVGAVTSAAIADGSVTSADLAPASVTSSTVQDGSLTGADVQDGSISTTDLSPEVRTGPLQPGESLRGAFGLLFPTNNSFSAVPISFGRSLSSGVTIRNLSPAQSTAGTAQCPPVTSGIAPASGNLCLYHTIRGGSVNISSVINPSTGVEVNQLNNIPLAAGPGVVVVYGLGSQLDQLVGVWAVTQ